MYSVNDINVDMLTSAAKLDRRHLYFYIVGPKTREHLQRELILIRRQVTRDNRQNNLNMRERSRCD